MSSSRLRREIAWEAARRLYDRRESEYYRAKMKAARQLCRGWVKPADLPSNAEIRDQVQRLAHSLEGDQRTHDLRDMRLEALRLMNLLQRFRPRLIGSVLTGQIRSGSDIDIHVFSDSTEAVVLTLQDEGLTLDVERKKVRKHGQERIFTHIHVRDRFPVELTVYPAKQAHVVFKSSVTGKAMERASRTELEQMLRLQYPELPLEQALRDIENQVDRFQVYESLLLPLEQVKQDRRYHPEEDALYHSLQVFEFARNALPYDEEFLLAALLHDVGKAIDPADHVAAGLEALEGFITARTAWLIRHHMEAQWMHEGKLGVRATPAAGQRELRRAAAAGAVRSAGSCRRRDRAWSGRSDR